MTIAGGNNFLIEASATGSRFILILLREDLGMRLKNYCYNF